MTAAEHARWLAAEDRTVAESIEAARALDGTPYYGRTFSFVEYLKGVNEGVNPRDRRQGGLC